ncbi:MAG: recombination protein RecR [Bacteroidales bacterium]|nr:recombination protein RecR [Bacteroidales bacterium]
MQSYPSKLVEDVVNHLSRLPGIGKRTALRLAIHLLKQDKQIVEKLGSSLIKMANEIKHCKICFNISDNDTCDICSNTKRDKGLVCIVEDIRDVMAIENTGQYNGIYHVLGGLISPMEGVGPTDLTIEPLVERISKGEVHELIMALATTIEGDTTNFYIYRRTKEFDVKISTLARGVAIGDELEYTDEITLGRSILNRMPYEHSLRK